MLVNVQPGFVNATINASKATHATAMLMNSMGQVIAQKSFDAHAGANEVQLSTHAGANEVQLSTSARGAAVLIVKMGSQKSVKQIKLR